RVKLEEILIFIAFFIVGYLPAFYYNQILYGSIWQGGYGEMNKSIADITDASSRLVKFSFLNKEQIIASFQVILSNIFYFGFRALESWQQFINYFMVMFYWIFWTAVFGLSYLIESWKEISNGKKKYLIVYLIISAILMFYYGSWEFNDNPDLTKITIGNSYTRYWLPIYLGAIPLTCLFVLRLAKIIIAKKENSFAYIDKQRIYEYNNPFASSLKTLESKNNIQEGFRKTCQWLKSNFTFRKNNYLEYYSNYLIVVFIGIICFISIQYVLIGSEEGLVESYYKHISAKEEIKKVFQLTPADSIVITEYHDKILFPERRVIVGLFNDDNMIVNYAKLAQKIPVYYFNFTFGEKDLEYLNNRRLDKFGLSLSKIENINAFSLYKVKVSQKSIDK
ncbi:MAG: hypothetical protein NT091_04575, partial [Candidatus Falkowbacteria bacterium]|nr:hypothetical protein [Candidatus Falkowbacteria bacterium]